MKRPRWLPRFRRMRKSCPECGGPVPETYCDVCGYDLVRKARADATWHRPPV